MYLHAPHNVSFLLISKIFAGALCLLLMTGTGCSPQEGAEGSVALEVGSRRIHLGELKKDILFISAGACSTTGMDGKIRERILNLIIEHYLVLEYGDRKGIRIDEREMRDLLDTIMLGYTAESFKEVMLRNCVDREEWEDKIREKLLVEKVIEGVTGNITPPSYNEIKRYFDANCEEFRYPSMVRLRQILTSTEKEAEKLLDRIKNGEGLGELARSHSIAPEAERGGEVGWIERGTLPEKIENMVFSMKIGEVSRVFKSEYGYHLFEVTGFKEAGSRTLYEVIDEIERRLTSERRIQFCREWIKELRDSYRVKVNGETLRRLEFS